MSRDSKWKHLIISNEVGEVFESYDEALEEGRREVYERRSSLYDSPESVPDDDAWEAVYSMIEYDCEDFDTELKYASNKESGHWLMTADLGLWYGRREGGMVFDDVYTAIMQCLRNMDYFSIHEDDYGNVRITGRHHDGINYYFLYRLSERGEEWYKNHTYSSRETVCRTLEKPHNRRAAKLLGLLYGKRYRHEKAA